VVDEHAGICSREGKAKDQVGVGFRPRLDPRVVDMGGGVRSNFRDNELVWLYGTGVKKPSRGPNAGVRFDGRRKIWLDAQAPFKPLKRCHSGAIGAKGVGVAPVCASTATNREVPKIEGGPSNIRLIQTACIATHRRARCHAAR
jgi:hypothetical protein